MIAPAEEPSGSGSRLPLPSGLRPFRLIVIYSNPSDFPGKFVVRDHYAFNGFVKIAKTPRCVADSLQEARSCLPEGLICFGPNPGDDPVIVESWM